MDIHAPVWTLFFSRKNNVQALAWISTPGLDVHPPAWISTHGHNYFLEKNNIHAQLFFITD